MNLQNTSETAIDLTRHCTVWTALITPFTRHDEIDFVSLRNLALTQAQAGNGILLLGSTGESLALTLSEQQQVVKFVCQLTLYAPLMVAAGGYNLSAQLAWISYCNALLIDTDLCQTRSNWTIPLVQATFICLNPALHAI